MVPAASPLVDSVCPALRTSIARTVELPFRMSDTIAQRWDMEPTQRVAVLTCVPRLLTELGRRPEEVFGALQIDAELFTDPDRRIPYSLASAILAACSRVTGIPHFGMLVGLQGDHRSLA